MQKKKVYIKSCASKTYGVYDSDCVYIAAGFLFWSMLQMKIC